MTKRAAVTQEERKRQTWQKALDWCFPRPTIVRRHYQAGARQALRCTRRDQGRAPAAITAS